MSAETLQAIEDAIRAHLADQSDDPTMVLNHWIVAYEGTHLVEHDDGTMGSCHDPNYAASDTSPMASLGLARWVALEITAIDDEGDDQ